MGWVESFDPEKGIITGKPKGAWEVADLDDLVVVFPHAEEDKHELRSEFCPCNPELLQEDPKYRCLLVHNWMELGKPGELGQCSR